MRAQWVCARATMFTELCQSSGAVWKSRWPSWAPVPNKPKVSVDVKQHSTNRHRIQHWTFFGADSKHWFTTSFLGGRCRKAMLGVCLQRCATAVHLWRWNIPSRAVRPTRICEQKLCLMTQQWGRRYMVLWRTSSVQRRHTPWATGDISLQFSSAYFIFEFLTEMNVFNKMSLIAS